MTAPDREGVLLSRHERGPCQGLGHIPGGTVRFGEALGEALTEAVQRVPREGLGLEVAGSLIGAPGLAS
jgi:ADP-ribose pyrophosphatase YjhB (NUDIX family)